MIKVWKWIALLLVLHSYQTMGQALSGSIQLENRQGTVAQILDEIETKTSLVFSYAESETFKTQVIELPEDSGTLEEILQQLFRQHDFIEKGNKIIIRKKQLPSGKATLNGYIKDEKTGESLFGATIYVREIDGGTVTNAYGFYALNLPLGRYQLVISYVGYHTQVVEVELTENLTHDIVLKDRQQELEEVVITGAKAEDLNVLGAQTGLTELNIEQVKLIPAVAGEVDLIKSIQLLPGVLIQGEGSTNYFVRGGGSDQNMILLDEAQVYNPAHLMGFFSVFNADVIKDMKFYRGGIPAEYGGRLSSLLDVRMKEGNNQKFSVSGGIGTLASRLTVEGPIKKDKHSFIVSARRTYADLFFKMSADEFTRQTSVYFYDLNAKLNFTLGKKDRLYFSGYFGRDLNKIRALQYTIDWGNRTGTLRWNHLFSDRLFANTTLLYSKYDYVLDLRNSFNPLDWRSSIEDIGAKVDFNYYLSPGVFLKFGVQSTYHRFSPGFSTVDPDSNVPKSNAWEHALYVGNDHEIGARLRMEYGLRASIFQLVGPSTVYEVEEGVVTNERNVPAGEVYKTYWGLEPRLSMRYLLDQQKSIKATFQRTKQYLQVLANNNLGFNAFDVIYPSSVNLTPQTADQMALGYFQNFGGSKWEFSVEGYYKRMMDQVDYVDHASLLLNRYVEAELLSGDAHAYGVETILKKNEGKLTGWASYTYSRAIREIPGINNGDSYPASYDQPHSFSAMASWRISHRWNLSANWVYATGRPTTLPVETFNYEGYQVPVFEERNSGRMPDYHRLDISATLYAKKKPNRKNHGSWVFTLYNAYGRANAATVFIGPVYSDIDVVVDPDRTAYQKLSLFTFVPSVTYNFKF